MSGQIMKWRVALWTPGTRPPDDGATFGCTSHGFAGPCRWKQPDAKGLIVFGGNPRGAVVAGRYAGVLTRLRNLAFDPQAAIVLFTRGTGMENFLQKWERLFPGLPTVGGAAARGAGQER